MLRLQTITDVLFFIHSRAYIFVKAGKIAYGLVDVLLGEKLTAFKYSLQTQFTIATLSGRVVETHKKTQRYPENV